MEINASGQQEPLPAEVHTRGLMLATTAAVGYSAANVFLRSVDHCDPFWVSCVKAIPTILVMIPWLLFRFSKGHRKCPALKAIILLSLMAFITHLFGNVGFQWSLDKIGIGIAVPLCLGMAIVTGAIVDGLFMDAKPSARTIGCMLVLIVAVITLSVGGEDAFASLKQELAARDPNTPLLIFAILAVIVSGITYGIFGAVLKTAVQRGVSQPMLMLIVSTAGLLFLLGFSFQQLAWEDAVNLEGWNLSRMLLAGVCNTIAFVALVSALQILPVTSVNVFNASQAAMGALAGVLIFGEPATAWMVIGIVLTMVGLVAMKRR